jgi:hypothetical protein
MRPSTDEVVRSVSAVWEGGDKPEVCEIVEAAFALI